MQGKWLGDERGACGGREPLQLTCRPTQPRFVFLSTKQCQRPPHEACSALSSPSCFPRTLILGSMVRSVIHSRFLLALLAALLLAPFVAAHDARALERRDISNIFSFPDSGTTSQTSTTDSKTDDKTSSTAATTTSSQTKSTQSSQANSASKTSNPPPSQTSNTASQTSTSNGSEQTSSGSTSGSTQATTSAPTSSTTQSASDFRTTSYSTKQDGGIVTVISTVPASDLASGTQPAPSQTGDSNDSSGISTGGIVGLSVAGGVALLAVVAFAIFKFSRKKYLDEYDDGT